MEVGMGFFGLQSMSAEFSMKTLDVIAYLTQKLSCIRETTTISSQCIANIMYGVQNFGIDRSEMQTLLIVLSEKLSICKDVFSEQEIGMCFFSMKNMRTMEPEVEQLLDALIKKLKNSDPLNSKSLCMILYGLQNFSSENQTVRRLISVLIKKLRFCKDEFNAREVGNALYGLQHFNSNSKEVLQLLQLLSDKIVRCKEELNDQEIGMALNGLKNMNENVIEVLNILSALDTLVPKVDGRKSFIVSNRCKKY
jgi:hypothetical protein